MNHLNAALHEVFASLKMDEDLPSDIHSFSRYDIAHAENRKAIEKISVGNRFRLIAGLPPLPETKETNDEH